jgi:hypothetical protein
MLQNGLVVDMSGGLDWSIDFAAAGNTALLWLHSIPFVHDLVEMHYRTGDEIWWAHARALLLDYVAWLGRSAENRARGWRDEHAVSNRCFVLADMTYRCDAGDLTLRRALRDAVREHAAWLGREEHYKDNNHGTMMDRALLQLSVLPGEMTGPDAGRWREVALGRLRRALANTFDADGCCVENSPSYHQLNVALFDAIATFLEGHGAGVEAAAIRRTLEKAKAITALFVRPDGSLPLIGDTQARVDRPKAGPTAAVTPRTTAHAVLPGAGFVILNEARLRVTAKCGGSSFSHRHIDETSITVRYEERDFIVDAGMYNHDITDRLRRWFISYRSHSGFFVAACENVRFANFRDATALGRIVASELEEGRAFVAMQSQLVEGVALRRDLVLAAADAIVLCDRMRAEAPQRWRQQFLLHPACAVEIDGRRALISRDGLSCEIVQQGRAGGEWRTEPAWYSETFMKAEPTTCVVFTGEASAVDLVTTMNFGAAQAPPAAVS